ncbi:MAG: chemotaxis protein CheD [Dehalococcoidia bacterium]
MSAQASSEVTTVVGLGEICVSSALDEVLMCLGIGSCIALCVYDPIAKISGMAHIVLPHSNGARPAEISPKYADVAVPLLLQEMCEQGAIKFRLVAMIAGGAQMIMPGSGINFNTGQRNAEAVMAALEREKVPVLATEIGGSKGRTVRMLAWTGKVFVRTSGAKEKELELEALRREYGKGNDSR